MTESRPPRPRPFNWSQTFGSLAGEVYQRQYMRDMVFLVMAHMSPVLPSHLERVLTQARPNIQIMRAACFIIDLQRAGYTEYVHPYIRLTKVGKRKYKRLMTSMMRDIQPKR